MTPEACATCGHHWSLHGRRGYGSCGHGRGGSLAAMVHVVTEAVIRGLTDEQRQAILDEAAKVRPCQCKRFGKRRKLAVSP